MPSENPQRTQYTHNVFSKQLSDVILEANITFEELKSRGRVRYGQGGNAIERRIRTGTNTIRNWGPMAQYDTIVPQLFNTVTYTWAGFYLDYFIDRWDIEQNKGPEAILDQQEELMKAAKEDFGQKFEDYMFTDGSSESPAAIGGFEAFIKTTGSYATRSQTNTDWQAQVIANSSTTFSGAPLDQLTELTNLCTRGLERNNSNRPQAGFTTRATWNGIHNVIEDIRRVVSDEDKVKVGHKNFLNDGVPYFWSDSCPATTVYLVNFSTLELVCQLSKLIDPDDFAIPKPNGHLYQLFFKGQLLCTNPRMNGKITGTNFS